MSGIDLQEVFTRASKARDKKEMLDICASILKEKTEKKDSPKEEERKLSKEEQDIENWKKGKKYQKRLRRKAEKRAKKKLKK